MTWNAAPVGPLAGVRARVKWLAGVGVGAGVGVEVGATPETATA